MENTKELEACQKIAIVGIGCRYAGGIDCLDTLWEVLENGQDCTSPHPESRYDVSYFLSPGEKLPGKVYNKRGGFLTRDPLLFDRTFFKMSQDEAQHMDPSIRLLLEVTWEALEDAGIAASGVRGSDTGVYIGAMSTSEYRLMVATPDHNIGQYTNSGNTPCMMSNRLSYEFDFHGPSLTLDTACSSSLYAIYLACEALKSKQCTMTVAGGVNMLLIPSSTIGLSQAGMLSPDGRSKSFDKSADGYARAEGAGIVILKTLEKALQDKDRIYAVLRGGALSNDGRTTGITSPSSDAQRKLLQLACLNARVTPKDITYAEAHGTGTAVGDKTEVSVLGECLGQKRLPHQPPLIIGSIKSNVGHTESAAGVAGVIKAAMCLKSKLIPRVVHFTEPNPALDFEQLNLQVPKTTMQWPADEPLIASCSSFGFGGSNACMILEAASTDVPKSIPQNAAGKKNPSLLLISAATKEALQQRLRDWLTFLQRNDVRTSTRLFHSALYTAAQRSHHHQCRLGFVVTTVEDAIVLIRRKLDDSDVKTRCVEGVARPLTKSKTIAFVFSGMGTQWWGMARELMHTEPVFTSAIKRISKILKSVGCKWSLVSMLTQEEDLEKIDDTEIAQPSICAVQIGLMEVCRSRGIIPEVVVGHSVGEVAAAYCAGLLSLKHAIGLIYHRGTLLSTTSGSGTMVAVLYPVSEVLDIIQSKGYDQRLDVAAINSPNQIVLSGDCSSINDLVTEFKASNIRCVKLKVRNAFHSRQQDCLESIFTEKVSKFLTPQTNLQVNGNKVIPMISTVTGQYLTREEVNTPGYWWRNIRQRVLFKSTVESLWKDEFQVFVEIGPHPALTPAVVETVRNIKGVKTKPITSGSLIRPRDTSQLADDSVNLLLTHAKLFVMGVSDNFLSYFGEDYGTVLSIPKYPWQRESCSAVTNDARIQFQFPATQHPLLGEQLEMSTKLIAFTKVWKAKVTKSSAPWLKDHNIGGAAILPAAAYIEISLAAAESMFPEISPIVLRNVNLQKFMYVPEGEGILETTAEECSPIKVKTTIRSQDPITKKWTQHAEIYIEKETSITQEETLDVEYIRKTCSISVTTEDIHVHQNSAGLTLGPSFQTATHAFVNDTYTKVLCYCEASDVIYREFDRYAFHPAMLDSCFQSYAILQDRKLEMEAEIAGTLKRTTKKVPSKIQELLLYKNAPRKIVVHLTSHHDDNDGDFYHNITVADADTNDIICVVLRLKFQQFEGDAEAEPHVWRTEWINVSPRVHSMGTRRCLVIPDKAGVTDKVVNHLKTSGVSTVVADNAGDSERMQQYLVNGAQHSAYTDILVLQPLDSKDAMKYLNSNEDIALETFRQIQEEFPIFLLSLIRRIKDLRPEIWPRVMIVTSGAHALCPEESENPFMAYVRSIIMTCTYEEPKLNLVSVDLPQETNVDQKTAIICEAFQSFPKDENMLAYRVNNDVATATDAINLMVPRLTFTPVSTFRIKTRNEAWVITPHRGKAKLSLKANVPYPPENLSQSLLKPEVVDVHAFSTISIQNNPVSNNELVTIFAGKINTQQQDKVKQHLADNDHALNETTVLGITKGPVSQSMTFLKEPSSSHFVEIPDNIECPEAIEFVKDFLPAEIFFQDHFPVSQSTKILCLMSKLVPVETLAFPLLACAKGAQVTVIPIGEYGEELDANTIKSLLQYENCVVATPGDMNCVENSTSDLLIVPLSPTSLQRHTPLILPKLKKSGLVLHLSKDEASAQSMIPSISGTKFMIYSALLTNALCSQTFSRLYCAMESLGKLLRMSRRFSVRPFTAMSCGNPMSAVSMVNGSLPDSVVICVNQELELPFELHADIPWIADKDLSYLVTGGTKGFGLSLVKWLVSRGATQVYVVSRRSPDEEALKFFTADKTINIQHFKADLSDAKRIEEILISIKNSKSPPLAGIFHFAVRYNDGFIFNINRESWNSVAEPKAYGALLLHQLTQKLQISLKHFVVSSSVVSMIGNTGQASYCAANNFMNSLCHMRRHQGLPATSLCIGYINSVGYAATNNLVRAGEERGIMSISPEELLKATSVAMKMATPQIGIGGPLIVRRFLKKNRPFITQHLLESETGNFSLYKGLDFADSMIVFENTAESVRAMLLEKSVEEAKALIQGTISRILSSQLGIPDDIDNGVSLVSFGLDSLMATTVGEAIADHFEVAVNAVDLINETTTIDSLYMRIFKQMKDKMKEMSDTMDSETKLYTHDEAVSKKA